MIHKPADVRVGVAIEAAIQDVGEIIRRNILAKVVALIYGRPQVAGLLIEADANSIPQSAGDLQAGSWLPIVIRAAHVTPRQVSNRR
jgi:hypothetical protein